MCIQRHGTSNIASFPCKGSEKNEIVILVAIVQKMQMVTQEGKNVYTIGVEGNFDDAQSGVKAIFTDEELKQKMDKGNFKFYLYLR